VRRGAVVAPDLDGGHRAGHEHGADVPDGIRVPDAVVPRGKLVLLGDNAGASLDSRMVGYFSAALLLGRVARRLH
jgi:type IV secretory pathway protease TraF